MPTDALRPPFRDLPRRARAGVLAGLCLTSVSGCLAPIGAQGTTGGSAGGGWGASGEVADGPGERALAASHMAEPVRNLPKARRGNMAEYSVRGRRYRTLESAAGHRERGVASWYGTKFHGRDTSSGEPFDMYALTAAHRHLPLPTFVRVTNIATGQSIVVKVNDRGPFVDDRIIDLSYAAALSLGMLGDGTAEVEIEALSTHLADATPGEDATLREPARDATTPPRTVDATRVIQLGAFSDDARATSLARRVQSHIGVLPRIVHDPERALWRVRVGPFADGASVDAALAGLASAGIEDYTLVVATPR